MRKEKAPYFDSTKLIIGNRYVAWLDVMGSRAMMTRSLATAANFIFKLHVAAIRANEGRGLSLYPMNDGVYAVGSSISVIKDWLTDCYRLIQLANAQAGNNMTKVFLARAAVAFGPVAEGRTLKDEAANDLDGAPEVKNAVLVGAPVINAFLHERMVSPFGVYVHESARTFAPGNKQPWSYGPFMRYWKRGTTEAWIKDQLQILAGYLSYCLAHSHDLEYEGESIRHHLTLAREYFDEPAMLVILNGISA